ncbi:biotin synthase-like enzyme [Bradyrhizobium diazoefficiens]
MDAAVQVQRKEASNGARVRNHWNVEEVKALYDLPFADLMLQAQRAHRKNFDPNHVETASLLSIKTGGCPEDCGYCSQSAHYATGPVLRRRCSA